MVAWLPCPAPSAATSTGVLPVMPVAPHHPSPPALTLSPMSFASLSLSLSLSLFVNRNDHGASASSPRAMTRCPIAPDLLAAPLLPTSHHKLVLHRRPLGDRQPPPFERSSSPRSPPSRICTRALPCIHYRPPCPPSLPEHRLVDMAEAVFFFLDPFWHVRL